MVVMHHVFFEHLSYENIRIIESNKSYSMLQIPIINHNIEREKDVVDLFDKLLYSYLILC